MRKGKAVAVRFMSALPPKADIAEGDVFLGYELY